MSKPGLDVDIFLAGDDSPWLREELSQIGKDAEKAIAKYKLEIYLMGDRSVIKDFKGSISTWLSGGGPNGDLDFGMFWCLDAALIAQPESFRSLCENLRDKKEGSYGCGKLIPPEYVNYPHARCPHCFRQWPSAQMTNQLPFYGSVGDLVSLLDHFFNALDRSADFYLKHQKLTPEQFQQLVADAQMGVYGKRDELTAAPQDLESAMYSLGRLYKDISSGSTLPSLLRAFLTA